MTTSLTVSPREEIAEHLERLQGYARRVVAKGETLSPAEEEDRVRRMREYLAIGVSFRCTRQELVGLLYKGLFEAKRGCGCFNCRSRAGEAMPSA